MYGTYSFATVEYGGVNGQEIIFLPINPYCEMESPYDAYQPADCEE